MNQGTFSDYHDNSGDGGSSFWPEYGCGWGESTICGIYFDNDSPMTSSGPIVGSKISWFFH